MKQAKTIDDLIGTISGNNRSGLRLLFIMENFFGEFIGFKMPYFKKELKMHLEEIDSSDSL